LPLKDFVAALLAGDVKGSGGRLTGYETWSELDLSLGGSGPLASSRNEARKGMPDLQSKWG
jgi:hypothetical protein